MTSPDKPQVVVAGHICFDLIPAFGNSRPTAIGELFVPGKLINMGGALISTGGPVSNTGIALATLGINTRLMGKIGNDYFGEGILKLLAQRHAADCMIVADGEETSYTVVIVPPGYDRIFLHNPGANHTFRADDINYDIVAQAGLFHFGYPPLMRRIYQHDGEELVTIFKRVKDLGVTTSLDMSLPDPASESGQVDWDRVLRRVLPHVDIFLPSVEETMFMIRRDEFNHLNQHPKGHDLLEHLDLDKLPELGARLIDYGTKIAVIKCGIKGIYIRTADRTALTRLGAAKPADLDNWANRELHEESFHVPQVAAATGSGDSSIAGFLAAYLNGEPIEQAIRIACAVGGQNVRVLDAVSGIQSWPDTLAMIPNWAKNRLAASGNYWHYDSTRQLRIGRHDRPTHQPTPPP